jgi:hypothetical protein
MAQHRFGCGTSANIAHADHQHLHLGLHEIPQNQ